MKRKKWLKTSNSWMCIDLAHLFRSYNTRFSLYFYLFLSRNIVDSIFCFVRFFGRVIVHIHHLISSNIFYVSLNFVAFAYFQVHIWRYRENSMNDDDILRIDFFFFLFVWFSTWWKWNWATKFYTLRGNPLSIRIDCNKYDWIYKYQKRFTQIPCQYIAYFANFHLIIIGTRFPKQMNRLLDGFNHIREPANEQILKCL